MLLFSGGLSRNRTNDTRIFSPLLYQLSYETTWLREKDLNQRPPGYEPDELPDCSIPRCELRMAEKLGFEPRRRANDLPVFKTGPFSHLGTSPGYVNRIAARSGRTFPFYPKTSGYASISFFMLVHRPQILYNFHKNRRSNRGFDPPE